MNVIANTDRKLSAAAHGWYEKYIGLTWPLMLLEFSGHGVPWIVLAIILILRCHPLKLFTYVNELTGALEGNGTCTGIEQEATIFFLVGLLTDLIWIVVIKTTVRRPRPRYNKGEQLASLQAVDKFSFPSGHTTRTVFVASYFVIVAQRSLHHAVAINGPTLEIPLSIISATLTIDTVVLFNLACYAFVSWAVFVAISRVVLGRHYVLDVLVGSVVGIMNLLLVIVIIWTPTSIYQPILDEAENTIYGYFY